MALQLSGRWLLPCSNVSHFTQCRVSPDPNPKFSQTKALSAAGYLSSPPPTIQIVGGEIPTWRENGSVNDSVENEIDWAEIDSDLHYWTRALRPVQWYPGHIAKTEKELKEKLKLMDVVIEVRDARIPLSTTHPQMDLWHGNRMRILVLNREDMISTADRNAWGMYFSSQGTKVVFSNGQLGMGNMKLSRLAKSLAEGVNVKRRAKSLLPRPVRAGIVGYPNVGKSLLINPFAKTKNVCSCS